MNARATVHLDAGTLDTAGLLRCDHEDGRVSFRLFADDVQVWLTGTAADFDLFADVIDACAARMRRIEEAAS